MGKGLNPVTLVAGVIAIAAIGLSVYMFLQVSDMKKQLGVFSGDIPAGLGGEESAAGEEAGDGHASTTSAAIFNEKVEVNYDLGKFTTTTADDKYAVLDITLVIESTFYRADFEHYKIMVENYQEDLAYYNLYLQGGLNEKGEPIEDKDKKGSHASRGATVVLAAHTAGPSWEPPTEPVEPGRPLTALEKELTENDSRIRDEVINQINSHNATDIKSPAGKPKFKQAIIDGINGILGDKFGKVTELFFNELIAT